MPKRDSTTSSDAYIRDIRCTQWVSIASCMVKETVKPRKRHYIVEKIDGCCCDTHRELENGKAWVRRLRVGTTCGVAGRTMVEAVNRQEIARCDDQVGSGTSLYTYGPNVCSSIYSRTFLTASWQSNVREIDILRDGRHRVQRLAFPHSA
jgi:hypothetical protein